MKKTVLALSCTAFLVACGGGGGGGGGTAAGPATPISAANQTTVAQDVLSSSFQLFDSAAQSPVAAAAIAKDERALMQLARAEMAKLPDYLAHAPKAVAGAVVSQSYSCPNGGNFVITANDADGNNVLSHGDSLTIAFNNCVNGSETASGSLGFSVGGMTGTVGVYPFTANMTMTFGNLRLAGSGYVLSANGSVTLDAAVNGVNNLSESISAPSLTMSATYAGITRTRSMNGYMLVHRRTPDGACGYLDSYEGGGTVTGSNALASVTVSFSTPFATRFIRCGTQPYPYTGQMTLTGTNGAQLRITAQDASYVTLELDADGNGTYESTTPNVPWSSLVN